CVPRPLSSISFLFTPTSASSLYTLSLHDALPISPGKDSLVIYSFMFPRDPGDERPGPASGQTARLGLKDGPCPSCVAFLDQLDGAAEHAGQHLNLAVVAKAPLPHVLTFAEERGWRR